MKTYFCSLLAVLFLSACSSDDDKPAAPIVNTPVQTSFVRGTIDGTEYNFTNVSVVPENFVDDTGYAYVDLHITATMAGDATKQIEFRLEQGEAGIGQESVYFFQYANGDLFYNTDSVESIFNVDVTENTTTSLKGTFSGTLSDGDTATATVANGTFDIKY